MKKRSSRGSTGDDALREWISDNIRYLVMIILLLLAGVVIATIVGLMGGVRSDRSQRNIPGSGAVVSGAELRESADNAQEEGPQSEAGAAMQAESETEAETETEAVKQIESEAETEKQTESEAESEKQTETEAETEKLSESEAESEKQTETEAETEKQSESEAETEEQQTEADTETEEMTGTESEEDPVPDRTQTGAEDGIKTGAGPASGVTEEADTENASGTESRPEDETEAETEAETESASETAQEWDREAVQDFDPEAPLVGIGAAQNSQQETEEETAPDSVDVRNTILLSGSSSMGGNSSSMTNRATGVTVTNAGIVLPTTLTAPTVPGTENADLPQETDSAESSLPVSGYSSQEVNSSVSTDSGLNGGSVLTAPVVQEAPAAQTEAPAAQTEAPQPTYLTMTGTCYLRSAPDYGDNILGTYQAGTTVLFYGPEEGWYKVEVDGMVGYMGPKFFQ